MYRISRSACASDLVKSWRLRSVLLFLLLLSNGAREVRCYIGLKFVFAEYAVEFELYDAKDSLSENRAVHFRCA